MRCPKRWVMLCWLVVQPAFCQEPDAPARNGGVDSQAPGAQMVREFERTAPRVGDALPKVVVWDDQGRPVDLGTLKGDYTVLVLARGYLPEDATATVVAARKTFLDFYMVPVPKGILYGKVTEVAPAGAVGDPIPRAFVHLFPIRPDGETGSDNLSAACCPPDRPLTAITDENGDYKFPPLPARGSRRVRSAG